MNVQDLIKEHKTYVISAGISIAATAIIVGGFWLRISSLSSEKADLDGLSGKIRTGEKSLSKQSQNSKDYDRTVALIEGYLANLPPSKNYYSWATEIIYAEADDTEFEIDAIEELNKFDSDPIGNKIQLESYSLRITAHGSYDDVERFVQGIEENYPVVRFSGLEISKGAAPEVHDIQIYIQWPFRLGNIADVWKNVEKAQLAAGKKKRPTERVAEVAPPKKEQPAPVQAAKAATPEPVPVKQELKPSVVKQEVKKEPIVQPEPAPAPKPQPKPIPAAVVAAPAVAETEPEPAVKTPVEKVAAKAEPVPVPVVEKEIPPEPMSAPSVTEERSIATAAPAAEEPVAPEMTEPEPVAEEDDAPDLTSMLAGVLDTSSAGSGEETPIETEEEQQGINMTQIESSLSAQSWLSQKNPGARQNGSMRLAELLRNQKKTKSDSSVDSLLDGLLEGMNE